ncbi:hypothetical protein FOZ63_028381 [Perkinsus olseni]|uniref:Uncharacterized protein n=1 Tax=Perkinsus olseni TaxID=32597 RepID=A0A7J6S9Z0_PEROL|nr:hypothetical protein FOZ63_028381 [Perkinsus olseni]
MHSLFVIVLVLHYVLTDAGSMRVEGDSTNLKDPYGDATGPCFLFDDQLIGCTCPEGSHLYETRAFDGTPRSRFFSAICAPPCLTDSDCPTPQHGHGLKAYCELPEAWVGEREGSCLLSCSEAPGKVVVSVYAAVPGVTVKATPDVKLSPSESVLLFVDLDPTPSLKGTSLAHVMLQSGYVDGEGRISDVDVDQLRHAFLVTQDLIFTAQVMESHLATLRYVGDHGAPTSVYPFNSNGSLDGIAGAAAAPLLNDLAMAVDAEGVEGDPRESMGVYVPKHHRMGGEQDDS